MNFGALRSIFHPGMPTSTCSWINVFPRADASTVPSVNCTFVSIRVLLQLLNLGLKAFHNRDVCHASALAHGLQAVPSISRLQGVDEGCHQLAAGCSQWV